MRPDSVLSTLGLAARAGKIQSGEMMTENAIRSGNANLVIVAKDVSDNTRKKFCHMCAHYDVPLKEYSAKAELGHCLGKEYRASLAVTDAGFAETILKKMD